MGKSMDKENKCGGCEKIISKSYPIHEILVSHHGGETPCWKCS